MKKLPSSIEIDSATTVEDARKKIAKAMGGVDSNRIGIYDSSKQIIKDRKAILLKQQAVVDSQEIMIKDLGMEIPLSKNFPMLMQSLQEPRYPGKSLSLSNTPDRSFSTLLYS